MSNKQKPKPKDQTIESASKTPAQPTHECEYYHSLVKNTKVINRKNRQIETLNRIIKNLKNDIEDLRNGKQKNTNQSNLLKQEIQSLKHKINQLQLKGVQYQRQLSQERLQHAIQLKTNAMMRGNKHKKNYENQYYSQCEFSRNTEQQQARQSRKQARVLNTVSNNKQMMQEPNMGELFMGRRGKIQLCKQMNRHSSWSKLQLLNQQDKTPSFNNLQRNYSKHSLNGGDITFESALQYLKKQNQNLRIPFF